MPLFIDETDQRFEEYSEHEKEHGYSPDELWNLDVAVATFLVPRLKGFKENTDCHPSDLTEEEWDEILDKMIWAFEFMTTDDYYIPKPENSEKVDEGIELFATYLRGLWI